MYRYFWNHNTQWCAYYACVLRYSGFNKSCRVYLCITYKLPHLTLCRLWCRLARGCDPMLSLFVWHEITSCLGKATRLCHQLLHRLQYSFLLKWTHSIDVSIHVKRSVVYDYKLNERIRSNERRNRSYINTYTDLHTHTGHTHTKAHVQDILSSGLKRLSNVSRNGATNNFMNVVKHNFWLITRMKVFWEHMVTIAISQGNVHSK